MGRRPRRRPLRRHARRAVSPVPAARRGRPARRGAGDLHRGGARRERRGADARRAGDAEGARGLRGREAAARARPRRAEAQGRRPRRPDRARQDLRSEEADEGGARGAREPAEGIPPEPARGDGVVSARADTRPRYMISVAADLVGMPPQTLRIYEAKGLVRPQRTAGNTRLYSEADLERLRLIQRLTTELGLNLAGVEQVLRLEDELRRMHARLDRMERQMREAIEAVHRNYRRDLVPVSQLAPLVRRSR